MEPFKSAAEPRVQIVFGKRIAGFAYIEKHYTGRGFFKKNKARALQSFFGDYFFFYDFGNAL